MTVLLLTVGDASLHRLVEVEPCVLMKFWIYDWATSIDQYLMEYCDFFSSLAVQEDEASPEISIAPLEVQVLDGFHEVPTKEG